MTNIHEYIWIYIVVAGDRTVFCMILFLNPVNLPVVHFYSKVALV